MNDTHDPQRTRQLLDALDAYRKPRQHFLEALGSTASNRDPLAEFSEHLVHALMGGALAANRVQVRHDLVLHDGMKVQVRYLANSSKSWVNEHRVYRIPGIALYALVIFEAFEVVGVLVFPLDALDPIGAALGKRHPRQDEQLQLTPRNWMTIRGDPGKFRRLGMKIWLPPLVAAPRDIVGL